MPKKPTVDRSGVDILFPRPRASELPKRQEAERANGGELRRDEDRNVRESENPNVRMSHIGAVAKEKEAFYLLPETLDEIEALRRRLRRDYGLSRRATSKSAIVDAAIGALSRNPDMLAAWLREFR